MRLNNPLEVMNHLITLLAAEGVEAFIGKVAHEYDVNELEDGLRIPAWENDKQELSRKAVYEFIFAKLAANPRKGFITEMPGVPNTLNVYTINPCKLDAGSELNCWDVMVWCAGSTIDSFNWEECVEGDARPPACMQGMDKPLAQLRSGLAGGIGVSMGLSQKSGNKSHFVLGTNVVSSRSVVKVKSGGLLSLESVQESWRQLRAKVRQPCHVEFLVPQFVADKTCSPDVFS